MKIIYCDREEAYVVQIEQSETVTILNTNDIVEAREEFLKRMKRLFNDTICKRLNSLPKENN